MISGLVYFNEVMEAVKDATGIENISPYYERIKRWIFRAEYDIAPSAMIVRKKITYTNGDGNYDGTIITLPFDFQGEYSYGKLNSVEFKGDHLELIDPPGPTEVDLYYMGFLLDPEGNPFTSRNHFEAVVKFCELNLYRPKIFLGKGNMNVLKIMQYEYDNLVLASRGNDAFGTEEDFAELGRILRTSSGDLLLGEYCDAPVDPFATTDTGESGDADCGTLTVDMVAVYEAAKID